MPRKSKKLIKELEQQELVTVLSEDIARFHKGEVSQTAIRDGHILVIILKDGRKYKVNFDKDDPRPVL